MDYIACRKLWVMGCCLCQDIVSTITWNEMRYYYILNKSKSLYNRLVSNGDFLCKWINNHSLHHISYGSKNKFVTLLVSSYQQRSVVEMKHL